MIVDSFITHVDGHGGISGGASPDPRLNRSHNIINNDDPRAVPSEPNSLLRFISETFSQKWTSVRIKYQARCNPFLICRNNGHP